MTLGETHTNVRGYHNVYPLTQKKKKADFICSAVSKKCSTKSGEPDGLHVKFSEINAIFSSIKPRCYHWFSMDLQIL